MKLTRSIGVFCLLLLVYGLLSSIVSGQAVSARPPRHEKLLNGLKLVMLPDPAADKVSVRLRIHSGSAFDPQGKEGVMKLLADNFFPTADAREFFEDLGGGLEVVSNYDYIQINASSRPDGFLQLLETVAIAVSNPTIDKETTDKLKKELAARVADMEKDPAYVADQAVANRLFGTFPYGRPQFGTPESLQKIDFADLRFAKERFLGADNATLAISGRFDQDLAFRAARRYFGAWLKSDNKVPPTFRQPDNPPAAVAIKTSPVANKSEFRIAFRGIARSDADYHATEILRRIIEGRAQSREGRSAFVRSGARVLPGEFVVGAADWKLGSIKKEGDKLAMPVVDGYLKTFLSDPVRADEFESAKRGYLSTLPAIDTADQWLDVDTYRLAGGKPDLPAAEKATLSDAQRILEKLQKQPAAYVLVFAPAIETATAN